MAALISIAAAIAGASLALPATAGATTGLSSAGGAETLPAKVRPYVANPPQCNGGADYGWMCAYSGPNYTGESIGMYYCENYPIPWTTVGSWDDNQTGGTRPWLYWVNGSAPWHMPAAYSNQPTNVDWTPVASITNC
jgi:hypothetical protein